MGTVKWIVPWQSLYWWHKDREQNQPKSKQAIYIYLFLAYVSPENQPLEDMCVHVGWALWVKCLLHGHKDLSSDPQQLVLFCLLPVWRHASVPQYWWGRDSWILGTHWLTGLNSSQVQWKTLSQKIKVEMCSRKTYDVNLWLPHVPTGMHTPAHTTQAYIHIHAHTTQAYIHVHTPQTYMHTPHRHTYTCTHHTGKDVHLYRKGFSN